MVVHEIGVIIYRELNPRCFEYLLIKCSNCSLWMIPKGSLNSREAEMLAVIRLIAQLIGLSSKECEIIDGFEKSVSGKFFDKEDTCKNKTIKYWIARLKSNEASITLSKKYVMRAWFTVANFNDGSDFINMHKGTENLLETAEQFLMKLPISKESGRRVVVVRHGERIDRAFTDWMKLAWDSNGCYKPFDLNVPIQIPKRTNYQSYSLDSPLTEVGYFEAQSVGRSLQSLQLHVDEIYCSPAFRCVQTATGILKMSIHCDDIKIKIEPGLFEFLEWYPELPDWFSIDDLISKRYSIDSQYEPIISVSDLKPKCAKETHEEYYQRCKEVILKILSKHPNGCNIVVVGHAPNLDASVRPVLNRSFDVPKDRFDDYPKLFPFCSFAVLEEADNSWTSITDRFPHFSYTNFSNKVTCEEFFNRP